MTEDPRTRASAIPTRWNGITFRSRLEARWAVVFSILGIHWEYEPLELGEPPNGYIPDFVVDCELYAGADRPPAGPVLVEVRPYLRAEEYFESIARIARSGWTGAAVVLGAAVRRREWFSDAEWWCGYGHPAVAARHADAGNQEWFQIGWSTALGGRFEFGGEYDLTAAWNEAGNRTRWKPSR